MANINDTENLLDSNGNEAVTIATTASAVNEITVTNAATGNDPDISATGDDTNVGISLSPKGTGNITLGNMVLDADQTIGAGQDNYVLTYDNSAGLISLEAASGGGTLDYELISTATASSSTSIDFTGLSSTYIAYKVVMENVAPATDATIFTMRTSTNNGSSYDAGASDYGYLNVRQSYSASATADQSAAASSIQLVVEQGNATNESLSLEVTIFNPSSTEYTHIYGVGNNVNQSGTPHSYRCYGTRLSAADVDAIRFLFSSGNIATGEFRLYGLRAS